MLHNKMLPTYDMHELLVYKAVQNLSQSVKWII